MLLFDQYPLKGDYAASFMVRLAKEMDDDLLILSSKYQEKEQKKYFGGDMKYLNRLFAEREEALQARQSNIDLDASAIVDSAISDQSASPTSATTVKPESTTSGKHDAKRADNGSTRSQL